MPIPNEDAERPEGPAPEAPEAPEERQEERSDEPEQPQVSTNEDGTVAVQIRKPSRAERRAERDPVRQYQTQIQRLEQERELTRKEMAELRGLVLRQNAYQQPTQQQGEDPYKAAVTNIRTEQEHIASMLRSGTVASEAEANRLRSRFYDLEDQKETLKEERLEQRFRQMQPQQQDPTEAILRAEFDDVMNNPTAIQYAQGQYYVLRAEGKPQNLATAREAFRRAQEKFIAGRKLPPPSPAQQQRYGAVPAQAGARTASGEVKLNEAEKRMAKAMYPRMTEDQAYITWAQRVGSKLDD